MKRAVSKAGDGLRGLRGLTVAAVATGTGLTAATLLRAHTMDQLAEASTAEPSARQTLIYETLHRGWRRETVVAALLVITIALFALALVRLWRTLPRGAARMSTGIALGSAGVWLVVNLVRLLSLLSGGEIGLRDPESLGTLGRIENAASTGTIAITALALLRWIRARQLPYGTAAGVCAIAGALAAMMLRGFAPDPYGAEAAWALALCLTGASGTALFGLAYQAHQLRAGQSAHFDARFAARVVSEDRR